MRGNRNPSSGMGRGGSRYRDAKRQSLIRRAGTYRFLQGQTIGLQTAAQHRTSRRTAPDRSRKGDEARSSNAILVRGARSLPKIERRTRRHTSFAETNSLSRAFVREETAATRSLLNTARLMDDNPTLLRLKELETLEKVTEKIDKLTVFGGLEGVLKDVVRIQVPGA